MTSRQFAGQHGEGDVRLGISNSADNGLDNYRKSERVTSSRGDNTFPQVRGACS